MKIYTLVLPMLLTGCGSMMTQMANYYDSRDPCQTREFSDLNGARLKDPGHQMPSYCQANNKPVYITRDYYSNRPLTTTQAK